MNINQADDSRLIFIKTLKFQRDWEEQVK